MSIDVITVAESFVYQTLRADPTVLGALPAGGGEVRVYPEVAPGDVTGDHIAHDLAGGGDVPAPMGAPLMWALPWDLTAWTRGVSRQALGPVVSAALEALCGPGLDSGAVHRPPYDDGQGGRWRITARYVSPVPAPGDYQASGVWRRVTHRVRIELSPHPAGA